MLRLLGYVVERNITIAGCQIDIYAEYRTGLIRLRLMVECKDYSEGQTVGIEDVKEFSGTLYPARGAAVDKGLLVARGGFTRAAKELADSAGIDLVQFAELANQLVDFDSYIDRVIKEFQDSPVAKYYITLSYALTEDYLGGDPDLIQRPLENAVNAILFQEVQADDNALPLSPLPGTAAKTPSPDEASDHEEGIVPSTPKPPVPEQRSKAQNLAASEGATRKTQLALLGNFGTGKTTWCRKYASDLAIAYKEDRTRRIPLVVSLSDYETKLDIQQLVTNTLQFRYGIRIDLSICQELQRLGRFVFLFDGLDEMATRVDADIVRDNLREVTKMSRIQENVFILTCRTHFFRDKLQAELLTGFETLFIPEWGETELREYLQRRFGDQWERQLDRIHRTHNLAELAQTPLFLEMITETLPTLGEQVRRSELYNSYTEKWIVEQPKRRGARLQSQDRRNFVKELATTLYRDNRISCHYSEFAVMLQTRFNVHDASQIDYLQNDVRNCTFLTRNSNGDYEFRHKSFMEYFVAQAIKDELSRGSDALLRLKPLPAEVRGFLDELLADQALNAQLLDWHKSATETVLRDNLFALMVDLRVAPSVEVGPRVSAETGEEECVLLFLQGDQSAFTEILHRYLPGVKAHIKSIVKDESAANEIAYDTFFSVLQHRDRVTSPKHLLPYLLKSSKWKAIDLRRREERGAERNISLDAVEELAEYILDENTPSPVDQIIRREHDEAVARLSDVLGGAMQHLDARERKVVEDVVFSGRKIGEVAKELGITIYALRKVRSNAVTKLRSILAEAHGQFSEAEVEGGASTSG